MNIRFWIVGGEFTSTEFKEIIEGTQKMVGPMFCKKQAEHTWREMSERQRSECNVRYTILSEPVAAAV